MNDLTDSGISMSECVLINGLFGTRCKRQKVPVFACVSPFVPNKMLIVDENPSVMTGGSGRSASQTFSIWNNEHKTQNTRHTTSENCTGY